MPTVSGMAGNTVLVAIGSAGSSSCNKMVFNPFYQETVLSVTKGKLDTLLLRIAGDNEEEGIFFYIIIGFSAEILLEYVIGNYEGILRVGRQANAGASFQPRICQ